MLLLWLTEATSATPTGVTASDSMNVKLHDSMLLRSSHLDMTGELEDNLHVFVSCPGLGHQFATS